MQLMDHELARLVREGAVEPEEAYARAVDKGAFEAVVAGRDPAANRTGPNAPYSMRPGASAGSLAPPAPPSSAPGVPPRPSQGPRS